MLFVLTAIENKEERPVAVVDNEQTANNWVQEGKNHNWIPFELNDVSGLGTYTPFKPAPGSPAEAEEKKRAQEHEMFLQMQKNYESLTAINKKLMAILKKKGIVPLGVPTSMTSSLLLTPAHKWALDVSRGQDSVDLFADLMERRSFAYEDSRKCKVHPQCQVMEANRECGDGVISIEFHTSNQEWFADINEEPYKEGTGLEELKVVTNTYGD
jgi:hypothetical protein